MERALFENDFRDIYVNAGPDGQPVFCYRTGMTVYEEAFDKGRLVSAGWNTAGTPLNVLEDMPRRLDYDSFPEPWAFDAEADGACTAYDWRYLGFEKFEETVNGAKALHGIVTLENGAAPLIARVHTVLSGSAVFTRYTELENRAAQPVRISRWALMSGGLEILYGWRDLAADADGLYELGYMENSRGCAEGLFRRRPLTDLGAEISGRFPDDRHRFPGFMLRNVPLGRIWIAQLAWSGPFTFRFRLDTAGQPDGISGRADLYAARLSFRAELSAPAPQLVLAPDERFCSPEFYIGCVQGDPDDAVNMMHLHTRRCVFTHPDPPGNLATVGAGIGPERSMTPEAIMHTIRTAAAVGAESCIVDAGWYCPAGEEGGSWWRRVGDWTPDPGKHGDGFASIRAACREHGLKFGLWMECERMGADTPVAKAHPDWYQTRRLKGQTTTVIDMANPEAAAWVFSEVCRVIESYGVELFRLDYNVSAADSVCRRGPYGESAYLRYYDAVYRMFGALRARYPGVIFENCAGGGARCDLGMARHFTHTWVSDWQIAPRSLAITNGITMFVPPERVDRLISGMNGHLRGSLGFAVTAALMGKPTVNTLNPMGSEMNPGAIGFVRRSFALYKEFIRPCLSDGYVFHHTPELNGLYPQGVGILERASRSGTRGVIGVFALASGGGDVPVRVYPRGTDPDGIYEVTVDGRRTGELPGYLLAEEGIAVRLPAALTARLIVYRSLTAGDGE